MIPAILYSLLVDPCISFVLLPYIPYRICSPYGNSIPKRYRTAHQSKFPSSFSLLLIFIFLYPPILSHILCFSRLNTSQLAFRNHFISINVLPSLWGSNQSYSPLPSHLSFLSILNWYLFSLSRLIFQFQFIYILWFTPLLQSSALSPFFPLFLPRQHVHCSPLLSCVGCHSVLFSSSSSPHPPPLHSFTFTVSSLFLVVYTIFLAPTLNFSPSLTCASHFLLSSQ